MAVVYETTKDIALHGTVIVRSECCAVLEVRLLEIKAVLIPNDLANFNVSYVPIAYL